MSNTMKTKNKLAPKRHIAKATVNTGPNLPSARYDVMEILTDPDDWQIQSLPAGTFAQWAAQAAKKGIAFDQFVEGKATEIIEEDEYLRTRCEDIRTVCAVHTIEIRAYH